MNFHTRHINWKEIDGRVYALNFQTGKYLAVDKENSEVWIAEHGAAHIDREISFRPRCKYRSAFVWILSTWIGLAWTRYSIGRKLKKLGFVKTFQEMQKIKYSQTPNSAAKIIKAFLFIDGLFLKANQADDCLVRSFALFSILTQNKIDACLHIGIAPYPFQAHAWVEVGSVPCLESRSQLSKWTPITIIRQKFSHDA